MLKEQNTRSTLFLKDMGHLLSGQPDPMEQLMPPGQNPTVRQLEPVQTMVFVSRAMPENILLQLLTEGAGRQDTVFLYRGWGDAAVSEVFHYAKELLHKLPAHARKNPPNIMVMPQAFAQYRISYVPAVLHRDKNKWYLVQGAPSLSKALDAIGQRRFDQRRSQQWQVSEPDQAEVMSAMAKRFDWQHQAHLAAAEVSAQMAGNMDLPTTSETVSRLFTPYMTTTYDIVNPHTGKTMYPKGTRFNVLALDPDGDRSIVVIDGRDARQVRYAQQIVRERPQTVVFYTRLGGLAAAGLQATVLNPAIAGRLDIRTVPSYLQQQGTDWRIVSVKPFD